MASAAIRGQGFRFDSIPVHSQALILNAGKMWWARELNVCFNCPPVGLHPVRAWMKAFIILNFSSDVGSGCLAGLHTEASFTVLLMGGKV